METKLLAIYKSPKKADTYLFVGKRDDFSAVPDALIAQFGQPQFVMLLPLKPDTVLALADIEQVKADVGTKGFYLQLPPPTENLLDAFRQAQGLND